MEMTATKNDTIKISGNMVLVPEDEYNDLIRAKENDEYRKKLERSMEQSRKGQTITFSLEELKAMESEDWKPTKKVKAFMETMKNE